MGVFFTAVWGDSSSSFRIHHSTKKSSFRIQVLIWVLIRLVSKSQTLLRDFPPLPPPAPFAKRKKKMSTQVPNSAESGSRFIYQVWALKPWIHWSKNEKENLFMILCYRQQLMVYSHTLYLYYLFRSSCSSVQELTTEQRSSVKGTD